MNTTSGYGDYFEDVWGGNRVGFRPPLGWLHRQTFGINVYPSGTLTVSPLLWRHNGDECVSNSSLTIVYSTVYSGADQRKHQSSASLAFVPVSGEFPAQMVSNAENVSIWWRHHARHGDVMKWKRFQHYGPFLRNPSVTPGRSPVMWYAVTFILRRFIFY